jgi:hypothetical protein
VKAASRGGPAYAPPVQAVPSAAGDIERWLGAIFPVAAPTEEPFRTIYYETYVPAEAQGKTFEELLGHHSGKGASLGDVRDLIGHALTSRLRGDPFELVNLDDRLFHRAVHHWLPLMKAIAFSGGIRGSHSWLPQGATGVVAGVALPSPDVLRGDETTVIPRCGWQRGNWLPISPSGGSQEGRR